LLCNLLEAIGNRGVGLKNLDQQYESILKRIKRFECDTDKYSGVFLPVPTDNYWASKTRVMLVGRETAGWNTDNKKNTLNRIFEKNEAGETKVIVEEAISRSRSKFKQFHFTLADGLSISPEAIVHCNIFAWDYDKKSPVNRPTKELEVITSVSKELLAAQIKAFTPHFIVFATGYAGITQIIKDLFNKYFGGYKTDEDLTLPKKLWEFYGGGSRCFRIAHPRALHGHQVYREQVIERIKSYKSVAENA